MSEVVSVHEKGDRGGSEEKNLRRSIRPLDEKKQKRNLQASLVWELAEKQHWHGRVTGLEDYLPCWHYWRIIEGRVTRGKKNMHVSSRCLKKLWVAQRGSALHVELE